MIIQYVKVILAGSFLVGWSSVAFAGVSNTDVDPTILGDAFQCHCEALSLGIDDQGNPVIIGEHHSYPPFRSPINLSGRDCAVTVKPPILGPAAVQVNGTFSCDPLKPIFEPQPFSPWEIVPRGAIPEPVQPAPLPVEPTMPPILAQAE